MMLLQTNPIFNVEAKQLRILLQLLELLAAKIQLLKEETYKEEILNSIFAAFVYEVMNLYESREQRINVSEHKKESLTLHFIKILSTHFREERNTKFYANMLNISAKYLSQIVKEVTGKTAAKLIDEMVLTEAKILLNNPVLTIAEIAELLYFSDRYFFSKFIKRHTGKSPGEYRKSI